MTSQSQQAASFFFRLRWAVENAMIDFGLKPFIKLVDERVGKWASTTLVWLAVATVMGWLVNLFWGYVLGPFWVAVMSFAATPSLSSGFSAFANLGWVVFVFVAAINIVGAFELRWRIRQAEAAKVMAEGLISDAKTGVAEAGALLQKVRDISSKGQGS